jgi:PAS domain S-box-containing protein
VPMQPPDFGEAHRRSQEILLESEERFRLLVEGVKDYAIFMLDVEGYVSTWNLGAQRIKGYEAKEIIGEHFSIFYTAEERLPADSLKIDRSFVKGLGEDVEDTAIVHMVIELAHTLGLEVIAEGVESEEQAQQLKEMGCDMAQDFYFSRSLPPEEIPALFSSDTLT